MGTMEIPDWPEIRDRVRHWVAFVGPHRLLFGSLVGACLVTAGWLLVRPSGPPVESVVPRVSGAGATVGAFTVTPAPDTRGTIDSMVGPDGRTNSQPTPMRHAPTREPRRRRRGPTKATQCRTRSWISGQSGISMAPMWTPAFHRWKAGQVV